MVRSLDRLREQYNSAAEKNGQQAPRGGPGPNRGLGLTGKPKDMRKTVFRLLSYMKPYRLRFVVVLACMLTHTVTSLIGSYMLAPIIDRLAAAVKPDAVIEMSSVEAAAGRRNRDAVRADGCGDSRMRIRSRHCDGIPAGEAYDRHHAERAGKDAKRPVPKT